MSSAPPASAALSPITRWLVLLVAAIGFLFDTYELLMFPVIGAQALAELLKVAPTDDIVRLWTGRMLWIAALAGGLFGLLGGFLIDKLGRKKVMVGSILVYSLSPVAAAFSTELWHLVLFRCTTFIGVCVELIAAVTWLAELFSDKRQREIAIGWTLACASLGGIFVTMVFQSIVAYMKNHPEGIKLLPLPTDVAWRYMLLTGLIPGALILLLMPFVPESGVWKAKKLAGTLKRPRFGELFSPELRRTTFVTTLLSACGYAAAFGALQLTPAQMVPGLPVIEQAKKDAPGKVKAATDKVKDTKEGTEERKTAEKELTSAKNYVKDTTDATRGDIQLSQELGGLTGRILFAILLLYVASKTLIRIFLLPGVVLVPIAYLVLYQGDYTMFAAAIFFCGLLTVASVQLCE